MPDPEVVAEPWETWRAEVAFRGTVRGRGARSRCHRYHGHEPILLREVLVHMIEEYARHNGHADFLRERIGGRAGQWASGLFGVPDVTSHTTETAAPFSSTLEAQSSSKRTGIAAGARFAPVCHKPAAAPA
ncbi:DUF664 domain-containing protein [Streptomyces sp. NPDC048479]|uniref:mycothiol transferase n=1 Tax=Streptomyces sp. NPDC048479 TaxID=3154725 RepID=UPI003448E6DF